MSTLAESLLLQVARGDRTAMHACIAQYGNLVWSLCRRNYEGRGGNAGRASSGEDVDDMVQEIFLDLWRSAASFDPVRGTEVTFVATIARRRIIDKLRKQARAPRTANLEDHLEIPMLTAILDDVVDAKAASAVIAEMPEQARKAIILCACEGFTHEEAAEALQIPLGTVKSHIQRGLLKLREHLSFSRPKSSVGP